MATPRRTPRYIPFQKPVIPEPKKKESKKEEPKKEEEKKPIEKKQKEEKKIEKKEEPKKKEPKKEEKKKEEEKKPIEKKQKEEKKIEKKEEPKKKEPKKEEKKKEEEKKPTEKKQKEEKKIEKKEGPKKKEEIKKEQKKEKEKEVGKEKKELKIDKKKVEKPKIEEPSKDVISAECILYTYPMDKFQICLADTEGVMVAVMLESEPSEPIKQSLISFTKDFSKKYEKALAEFSGKVSDFESAKELVDTHFNLFLIKPIVLPLDPEKIKQAKINSIENSILKVAREISKERGFFFTATLIEKVIKELKIARDKIVKAIFGLKDKGLFIAIDIEKVAEFAERRMLWDQISENKGLSNEDSNVILEDLLVSSEGSRKIFLEKIQKFPKKNVSGQIQAEIENRKKTRDERKNLFSQLDDAVKRDDFATASDLLSKISVLSAQLYEHVIAKEFSDRAQLFGQTAEEMRSRIPRIRNERNEVLKNAEILEMGGKYEDAAKLFEKAAKLSEEIGEMAESKKFLDNAERMKNLNELAKLREALK